MFQGLYCGPWVASSRRPDCSPLRPIKSGYVSLSTAAETNLTVSARAMGIARKKHMRNLGRDMHGGRARGAIEASRGKQEMRQRLAALKKAAGGQKV